MGSLTQLQQIGIGSAGLGVAGSAVSGLGQYETGQQQKQAYDYNAAVTIDQMQLQMQMSQAKTQALTGKRASQYAKAGVDISSGSPLLMMAHAASQGAKEQESEYQAGTQQAALDKYYGKVAAFQGTVGGIGSFISGLGKGAGSIATILA